MADSKIVTKKTAAKPSAPTDTRTTATPVAKQAAAKKPDAPTTRAAPTQPVMSKAAAAAAAVKSAPTGARPPTPAKTEAPMPATKKSTAKKAEPNPQPPLEDKPVSLQELAQVTPEHRLEMIREAAYYKAEKRNFTDGSDAQDWADAEREIDDLLAKARQICGG